MTDIFAPFDLGNVLSTAENIRGARSQNQLARQQIQRQNALLQRNAQGQNLLQGVISGQIPIQQLAGFDIEAAQEVQTFRAGERERQVEEATVALRRVRELRRRHKGNLLAGLRLEEPEFLKSRSEFSPEPTTNEEAAQILDNIEANFRPLVEPERITENQRQTNLLIQRGLPRRFAENIAEGFIESSTDANGRPILIDKTTGQSVLIDSQIAQTVAEIKQPQTAREGFIPQEAQESFIPPDIDPAAATGAPGFFGNISNKIADFFGQPQPFADIQQATNALDALRFKTVGVLQETVPGRPNEFLLRQIDELTVKPNRLFTGDREALSNFTQTKSLIDQEISDVTTLVLQNPTDFKTDTVQKAQSKVRELQSLSNAYGVILNNFNDDDRGDISRFLR